MKTSMAYRMYRLYFNSNSDNYQLFGNRVHNPLNGAQKGYNQHTAPMVRIMIMAVLVVLLTILFS